MPILKHLRAAHRDAASALRDAEDRLGQARDRYRTAIQRLARLEQAAIDEDIDPAELEAARTERHDAETALRALEDELRPRDRTSAS